MKFIANSIYIIILFSVVNICECIGQPALSQKEGVCYFTINDEKFLMLGGQLHNSTSTSEKYMNEIGIWEKISALNFNTLIATCSWDVIEPTEGVYDFSSVDHIIKNAEANNIKIVMIWFASWKNSQSTYAPSYIKRNPDKYPLIKNYEGKTLNILSPFSEETNMADLQAFVALMKHIKQIDNNNTVIMMQIENEMGILGSTRDFSVFAEKEWKNQVPEDLLNYLKQKKGSLFFELENVWAKNGYKTIGNWEDIFGVSCRDTENWKDYPFYTEEIFMAYYYAKYVERIVGAGKVVHNIPMYVNNWLKQPGMGVPGQFPSGSPLPEVIDIWRAAAPSIDFTAPDIYINEYDWVLSQFSLSNNPIFIPECRIDVAKALYAIGEYDALGFSPFGIDGNSQMGIFGSENDLEKIGQCYEILGEMSQVIINNYGSDRMRGILLTSDNPVHSVDMGDYIITTISSANPSKAENYGQGIEQMNYENNVIASTTVSQQSNSGALIIQLTDNEFFIVGSEVRFSFDLKDESVDRSVGIELIEEGKFINNEWIPGRRLNGDEFRVRIQDIGVLRVVLYKSIVSTSR